LHAPGDNRPKQGGWTQLILPVSGCDINVSVRVLSNLFSVHAALVASRRTRRTIRSPSGSIVVCLNLPIRQTVQIGLE
jgi:hypothetical protein